FNVADLGDVRNYGVRNTLIQHVTGQRSKAEVLKRYVGGTATIQEVRTLGTADVSLVIGADFKGVRQAPTAGTAPATTVAPPASTPRASGTAAPAC
ncbi:MAG: hypothetical protein ACRDY5_05105, partial [Acidimicrobiales bacterium]